MHAKVQKLDKIASSVDVKSAIFKGISIYVNGYTGIHTLLCLCNLT